MENTRQEYRKLTEIQNQIAELQASLKTQESLLVKSVVGDFADHLQTLQSLIKQCYTRVKLVPAEMGFIVTSPEFKESSATEIANRINTLHKASGGAAANLVKIQTLDWYSSQNISGPKEIKLTLTKAFIQSVNKEYKNILNGIEI